MILQNRLRNLGVFWSKFYKKLSQGTFIYFIEKHILAKKVLYLLRSTHTTAFVKKKLGSAIKDVV